MSARNQTTIRCDGCGQVYHVPSSSEERRGKCRPCGNEFVIPAAVMPDKKGRIKPSGHAAADRYAAAEIASLSSWQVAPGGYRSTIAVTGGVLLLGLLAFLANSLKPKPDAQPAADLHPALDAKLSLSRDKREYASVSGVDFSDTNIRDDGQELAELKTSHLARTQVADTGLKHIDREQTFGRSQVELFIRDRPGAGGVIHREPALRKMLESSFEGDDSDDRIYWDGNEPGGPGTAEHTTLYPGRPSLVRVTNRRDVSPVDKCEGLVYELMNHTFDYAYRAYENMAHGQQIGREEYAMGKIRIEMAATQKTKEYFQKNPIADANDWDNPGYASTLHFSKSDGNQWLQKRRKDNGWDGLFEYYQRSYGSMVK
jgi:hypothetical protein